MVGNAALELLKEHFAAAPEELDVQITVEIEDIRRETYFKHPSGTWSPPPSRQV